MKSKQTLSVAESIRLDAIVTNLGLGKHWTGPEMVDEVVEKCEALVNPFVRGLAPKGEVLSTKLATHFHVKFEEVRCEQDVSALEDVYLRQKREPGFLQLRDEILSPENDALLFQRLHAKAEDPDRWVAVLNLLKTEDRAYWNRFHELSHRIAEPPQFILPFRRQRTDDRDAVEEVIDSVAGAIGFHRAIFDPLVAAIRDQQLTFDQIAYIRNTYAPTASLLAVTNAVVKRWPRPALAFIARMGGRLRREESDVDLRVCPQGRNACAKRAELVLIPNMRVPKGSVVRAVFLSGQNQSALENTGTWTTSDGGKLRAREVLISAVRLGSRIYGLMSM